MGLIKSKARMFAITAAIVAALMGAGLVDPVGWYGPVLASSPERSENLHWYYLECPRTEVVEGQSIVVYLIRHPGLGHETDLFAAKWHTDAGSADESDYVPLPGESEDFQWTTIAERDANRQPRTISTIDDDVLEGDEDFWVRFSPTDRVVDPGDPARDERCMITIVDDDPHVTNIEMVSSPGRRDTYGMGETIEFAATFSHPVEVRGQVDMGFFMGGELKRAEYRRGSGTDTLEFSYTVHRRDKDDNGISVQDGYVEADGQRQGFGGSGGIFSASVSQTTGAGIPVYGFYRGLRNQSDHKVDGSQVPRPMRKCVLNDPADGHAFRAGETIKVCVVFSAPVRALNTPQVSLWFDGLGESEWRGARYVRGSGTRTLEFEYEVRLCDKDRDGFVFGAKGDQGMGEGKIKALYHDVNALHNLSEWHTTYKVDG